MAKSGNWRNRPFTVYGFIEKTLLDIWCVFVTINLINRSFKWIMSTDRQQHMNWTAFWWQSQRAHDRRSRLNVCRSGRKITPDQLSDKILPQEYNYEMENAAAFLTKISFSLASILLYKKIVKNYKSFITTVLLTAFLSFSPAAAIY